MDIFQEAKRQIEELTKDPDKPFALFLSTFNTHFPNGIVDRRMLGRAQLGSNRLEFTASSLDYLIGEFIAFLEQRNLLENTAVFIFPDHILMGTTGPVIEKLRGEDRQLYLVTNGKNEALPFNPDETIYQIDLPRIIIDGAGIKSNARFLTDYIKSRGDLPAYLDANQAKFATLNTASVIRHDHSQGFSLELDEKYQLRVSSTGTDVTIPINARKQNPWVDITYSKEMVLIDHKVTESDEMLLMAESDMVLNQLHLIVKMKDGRIEKTYFGKKNRNGDYPFTKRLSFSKDFIEPVMASNVPSEALATSIDQYAKDRSRFIAHAGGMIDGKTYTNSLEALETNWEKGFRLFELDIIKTSDDVFVAAHDWEQWANITSYEGALPPTREVFLEHKIHARYTPLDMDGINKWFSSHPEAILVTDKINTPAEFSRAFIDKERLMMELFSWDAVKEGIASGIKSAMPTGSLVWSLPWAHVDHLVRLGVTDVAASRRLSGHAKGIARRLTNFGIRVYAFHVNFDPGKDEAYVACRERDLFYGMYADKWDFQSVPECARKTPRSSNSAKCPRGSKPLASQKPDERTAVQCEITNGTLSGITVEAEQALLIRYCESVKLLSPFTVEAGGVLSITPTDYACDQKSE